MPLRSWAAFYRAVEAARLRDYARMVGVVHAKNPRQAQRDLLRAAAQASGRSAAVDLLGDPRRVRRMVSRLPGVAVEDKPPEPEGPSGDDR